MTSFGGALDLSRLANKNQAQTFGQPHGHGANHATESFAVSSWIVPVSDELLRSYLAASDRVVVLLLLTRKDDAASAGLKGMLEQVLESAQGRFATLEIDADENPGMAKALAVVETPTLLAILAGQPAPVLQGLPAPEQLTGLLSQVLKLAVENGITGTAHLAAEAAGPGSGDGASGSQAGPGATSQASPEHTAAFEAIEAQNYELAKGIYQGLLLERPADDDAKAGLAQVEILMRLARPEVVPGADASSQPVFRAADEAFTEGDYETAFEMLLEAFEIARNAEFGQTDKSQTTLIQDRLLQFFLVLGDSNAAVMAARRRFASLLF